MAATYSHQFPPLATVSILAGSTDPAAKRRVIVAALEKNRGGVKAAATDLGIARRTLWYHLDALGLGKLPAELRERARREFVVD